jgi:hypothetical protein
MAKVSRIIVFSGLSKRCEPVLRKRRCLSKVSPQMNSTPEEPSIGIGKLRPWFWFVLFLTPVLSLIANGVIGSTVNGENELPYLIAVDLIILPSIAVVCSAFCALHLSRVRTGRAHLGWILGGLVGFGALNLGLAFGGCMLGMMSGEKLWQ